MQQFNFPLLQLSLFQVGVHSATLTGGRTLAPNEMNRVAREGWLWTVLVYGKYQTVRYKLFQFFPENRCCAITHRTPGTHFDVLARTPLVYRKTAPPSHPTLPNCCPLPPLPSTSCRQEDRCVLLQTLVTPPLRCLREPRNNGRQRSVARPQKRTMNQTAEGMWKRLKDPVIAPPRPGASCLLKRGRRRK